MKLKTRIIVGFLMIILVPLLLFAATLYGFGQSQARQIKEKNSSEEVVYDIAITESENSQAKVQLMTKDLFFFSISYSYLYWSFSWIVDIPKHCNSPG